MTMEASKCPKCGEEPAFIEHIEKWYCYGCNSYIDEGEDKHACNAEHTQGDQVAAIADELKALEEDEAKLECGNCGAELQDLKDGRLYCFMCETYQDEIASEKEEPKPNEAQVLLDAVSVPTTDKPPESAQAAVEVKPEVVPAAPEPAKEPGLKSAEIRMCPSCSQPLKFIEKYHRHYCYGCRKYAPKDEIPALHDTLLTVHHGVGVNLTLYHEPDGRRRMPVGQRTLARHDQLHAHEQRRAGRQHAGRHTWMDEATGSARIFLPDGDELGGSRQPFPDDL